MQNDEYADRGDCQLYAHADFFQGSEINPLGFKFYIFGLYKLSLGFITGKMNEGILEQVETVF